MKSHITPIEQSIIWLFTYPCKSSTTNGSRKNIRTDCWVGVGGRKVGVEIRVVPMRNLEYIEIP